jgi:hypothetical protein
MIAQAPEKESPQNPIALQPLVVGDGMAKSRTYLQLA